MDAETLWQRVRKFAEDSLAADTPVHTLDEQVRNFITDVREGSIGRRSDNGSSNVSRVTRGGVRLIWEELHGGQPAKVLYFARALVLGAVPELVELQDGRLQLRRPNESQRQERPTYVPADEHAASANRAPFEVDPDKVDRGTQGHARTQNALAAFVQSRGLVPRPPGSGDPLFDLAWSVGPRLFVAEVKSITSENEERQLRLGLGQVLRYAHLLASRENVVVPVLALESVPGDRTWVGLCQSLGVILTWPGAFQDHFGAD
jgi:hypothetical protein